MNYIDLLYIGLLNVSILIFFLAGSLFIVKPIQENGTIIAPLNLLIGIPLFLTLLVSIVAILIMGFKTIFIIAIFVLVPFINFKPKVAQIKSLWQIIYFYLPFLLLIFILKSLSITTPGTDLIGTTAFDDFSYTSQINLLLKIKKETWFLELERGMFNEDVAIKPYHYFEFYLAIFLKYYQNLHTYQTYHLSLYPILQTLAIGSGTMVIRYFSKWKNYQVLLLSSCLFLCLRYTVLDEVIFQNLSNGLVQIFKHFAFQKVFLNDAGPHLLSSFFGLKLCITLIFTAPLICLQKIKSQYKYLITGLLPIISISYFPFTILFCMVGFVVDKFDFKWFLPLIILILILIFYTINGNGEVHGDKVNFIAKFIETNIADPLYMFKMFNMYLIQILEFTYLTFLISFIIFFSQWRNWKNSFLIILFIISIFPLLIYEKGNGLMIFYILIILYLILNFRKIKINEIVAKNYQVVIVLGSLFLAIISFGFIIDFSQIFILFFYSLFQILIGLNIATKNIIHKNTFSAVCICIILFNIYNLNYNFNRESQAIISSQKTVDKIKKWFEEIPNHRAVHFNILTNSPFLASSMIGHEFLQYSDSVTSAWISIDEMTKGDSLSFIGSGLRSYVDRFTFNSYYKKTIKNNKRYGLKTIQKKFIIENDIHLVFISDNIKRSSIDFISPSIIDSIRIENGKYTALLIDSKALIEN